MSAQASDMHYAAAAPTVRQVLIGCRSRRALKDGGPYHHRSSRLHELAVFLLLAAGETINFALSGEGHQSRKGSDWLYTKIC